MRKVCVILHKCGRRKITKWYNYSHTYKEPINSTFLFHSTNQNVQKEDNKRLEKQMNSIPFKPEIAIGSIWEQQTLLTEVVCRY